MKTLKSHFSKAAANKAKRYVELNQALMKDPDFEVPNELDQAWQRVLNQRHQKSTSALRRLTIAACLALAVIGTALVLFLNNSNARHDSIGSTSSGYQLAWVPDGFAQIEQGRVNYGEQYAFQSENGASFIVYLCPGSRINFETGESSLEEVDLDGQNAFLAEYGQRLVLFWQEPHRAVSVSSDGLKADDLIRLAKSLSLS